MRAQRHLLFFLALVLAGGACSDVAHGSSSGFRVSLSSDEARMTIGGSLLWFWNEAAEAEYQGWSTTPDGAWRETIAGADIAIYQNATTQIAAEVALESDFQIQYRSVVLGFGARLVYPVSGSEPGALDRAAVGLDVGEAPVLCTLNDTRIAVALSDFPDGPDAIMAKAAELAAARGVSAPKTWTEVVHDPEMYDFLFREHNTQGLALATFAYVTIYVFPTCDDRRLFFISEDDLIGPVIHDP